MSLFGSELIRLLRERWANPTLLAEELFAVLQVDLPASTQAPVQAQSGNSAEPPLTVQQTGPAVPGYVGSTVNYPAQGGYPPFQVPGAEWPPLAQGNYPPYPPGLNFPPFPGFAPDPRQAGIDPVTGDPTPFAQFQRGELPPLAFTIGSDGGLVLGGPSLSLKTPDGIDVPIADKKGVSPSGGQQPQPQPQPTSTAAYAGQILAGGPGAGYQVAVYTAGRSKDPTEVSVTQLSIASDARLPAGLWVTVFKDAGGYWMNAPTWGSDT